MPAGRLRQLRRKIQIVFQDPMGSLDPRMKVLDIITEPLLVPGRTETAADRRRMATEMLEAVGLGAEVTAEVVRVGRRSRTIEFRAVVVARGRPDRSESAAEVLAEPVVATTATGTVVVP